MDTNSRTARWEPRSFKDIAFLTCTTLTEYHRAHKTKVKELSCKIKSSSLKRNVTPSHAWTAHCTSCSQDKNLIIQKNTHDSPMTGNVTAEDVLSCWKNHRALTLISALVIWRVLAQQLLTHTHTFWGRTSSPLQTCSSQGQELPVAPGQPNSDHHFPGCSHTNVPDLGTQGSARGRESITSASTERFWNRSLSMKHFPSPFSAREPAG